MSKSRIITAALALSVALAGCAGAQSKEEMKKAEMKKEEMKKEEMKK